jgi:hypothetical protein
MDALRSWRAVALEERAARLPIRPTSPLSEDEDSTLPDEEEGLHHRAMSEPPEKQAKKSRLSWVQWWTNRRASRGRRDVDVEKGDQKDDKGALNVYLLASALQCD